MASSSAEAVEIREERKKREGEQGAPAERDNEGSESGNRLLSEWLQS